MPKPSIYKQIDAVQVDPRSPHMKPSPRHWNCGMIRYKGRLWLAYRYHLGREHGSRCATGMVPLDKTTLQPTAPSQHLNLPAIVGDEHFEDARLFMFNGAPHISYTQMTGYKPGVDYTCFIKYARLKLNGNRWLIEDSFRPVYGVNHGPLFSKEKNWIFFEHNSALYCIYQDHPTRKVIKIEGERIVDEFETGAPIWPWGSIRGGTPPVPFGQDEMMVVFHSSLQTEDAPHYRRYYAAAYTFEAKPPFRITKVSAKPIISGSEADGHGFDPRYSEGWKPFIPFPCGLVADGDNWLVSLGVNDWQCAVGKITPFQLNLISPDRSDAPVRYFMTANGSLPARMIDANGQPNFLQWEIPVPDMRGRAPRGLFATADGREAEALADAPRCEEITEQQYRASGGRMHVRQHREALPVFG